MCVFHWRQLVGNGCSDPSRVYEIGHSAVGAICLRLNLQRVKIPGRQVKCYGRGSTDACCPSHNGRLFSITAPHPAPSIPPSSAPPPPPPPPPLRQCRSSPLMPDSIPHFPLLSPALSCCRSREATHTHTHTHSHRGLLSAACLSPGLVKGTYSRPFMCACPPFCFE